MLDGVKAECEPLACRTLGGIGGRIIGEVILAEEAKLLVGRGERTGSIGVMPASRQVLTSSPMVVANVRHGLERAAQDVLGLQRHGAEPVPVARIVRHLVGDNKLVLPVNGHLHVVADLGATALPSVHRTAFWSREGRVGLAPLASHWGLQTGIEKLALLECLNLCL